MTVTTDEVLALEQALVAAATGTGTLPTGSPAALGAIASRYLAVGTPRSFAIVGPGAASLAAHRTWFQPRDVRCTDVAVAAEVGGRVVSLDEALAADIVCVHAPLALAPSQLRRGTHVNTLAPVELAPELRSLARVADLKELASLAAGLVDGRTLDEITVFVAT